MVQKLRYSIKFNQFEIACCGVLIYVHVYYNSMMYENITLMFCTKIGGIDWQEANDQAMAELKKDPNFAIIPPFDHPSIW